MRGWIRDMDYTSCTWQKWLHEPTWSHNNWDYTSCHHRWKIGMHRRARQFHLGGVYFSLHRGLRRNCYHCRHHDSGFHHILDGQKCARLWRRQVYIEDENKGTYLFGSCCSSELLVTWIPNLEGYGYTGSARKPQANDLDNTTCLHKYTSEWKLNTSYSKEDESFKLDTS